jgi:hypothetical protein
MNNQYANLKALIARFRVNQKPVEPMIQLALFDFEDKTFLVLSVEFRLRPPMKPFFFGPLSANPPIESCL